MSKELEMINHLITGIQYINQDESPAFISQYEEELSIIESALKRLEVYENYNINLNETDDVDKALELNTRITIVDKVMDTQERLLASVSADEIRILSSVLNSQIRNLKKKLKALEIIKKKEVNVRFLISCKTLEEYNCVISDHLTQEEYDLLKEVLL